MPEQFEIDTEPRHAEPRKGGTGVAVNDLEEHLALPVELPSHRHASVVARWVNPVQFVAGFGIDETHKILVMRRIVREASMAIDEKRQFIRHCKCHRAQHAGE